MPSPFPGMDPYLEPGWLDIHAKLVADAGYALNGSLPDELVARSEDYVGIDDSFDPERIGHYKPDVRVFGPRTDGASFGDAGGIAVSAPMKLVINADPVVERSLQILHGDDERLITIIEFLSPSNKVGRGLKKYLARREDFLGAGIHVVEIDLVRRGDWRAIMEPHAMPPARETTYRATVRVATPEPDTAYVYPIRLDEPLPAVSIPLRPGDAEVKLELQPLIDRAYDGGKYARTIRYDRPLDPPLSEGEAAWASTLLATRA